MRYERIGVDLGSNSIKIIAFRNGDISHGIMAMEIFDVKDEPFSKKYFIYLRDSLKEFLKFNHISRASLCFTISLSENATLEHLATFPIIKPRFLKKSIGFELEDLGKYSNLREYYYKWEITNVDKELNKNDVLILGIKQEIINQISKVNSIKLKIEHIEVQPITLGRFVDDSMLILDFGQEYTRIFYYKKGYPVLIKNMSLAGKNIDEIILEKMGPISNEELNRIKQEISLFDEFPNEEDSEINSEIRDFVEMFIDELKRYIRSIELQNEIYFENIQYSGGMINMMGLRDHISEELNIKLHPLSLDVIPEDSTLGDSESSMFLPAISAAMYKNKPYLSSLSFTKLAKTQIDYSPFFIAALCASIVLNFAAMDVNKKYDERVSELSNLSSTQSAVVTSMESEMNSINGTILRSNEYIEKVLSLSMQNKWISDVFYMLMTDTPKEVVIKDMEIKDGDIVMNGYAKDYSSIAFLTMSLEKHGDVDVNTVTNDLSEEIYSQSEELMTRGFNIRLVYSPGKRLIDDSMVVQNENAQTVVNVITSEENMDNDIANEANDDSNPYEIEGPVSMDDKK